MKRFLAGIVALVCVSFAAPAHAESSLGGAFRLPAYGARGSGMGGAVSAVIDDESAVDWNPARLSLAPRAVGASYLNLVQGTTVGQSQLVFVTPLGGGSDPAQPVALHAFGVLLTNLSVDLSGEESYSENHVRVAYALSPQPLFSVAIAGQLFISSSGVPGFDAWGTGIDMAGRLSLSRKWDFAIVGRDVFSRYTYDDGRDYRKERMLVLGLATRTLPFVVVSADIVRGYASFSRWMLGAESDYILSRLSLRAGATFHNAGEARTAVSFGASVRGFHETLAVHYAANFDTEEALGTTHRLSLGVRF